jgi:tRNA A-37 threonylcarbamoyl transferase component Bud32
MIPILDNSANPIHPCNETDLSKSNVKKDIMIPKKSKYLSKREIIEIFNKYNYKNDSLLLDNEKTNFIELCKVPNIKSSIIKDCFIKKKINIDKIDKNNHTSFDYILNNFNKSDVNTINNNINVVKYFIKKISKNSIIKLKYYINIISNKFIDNKQIFSNLKALLIDCNKYSYKANKNNKNKIIKETNKIDELLDILKNSDNFKRIIDYLKTLYNYTKSNEQIVNNCSNKHKKLIEIINYIEAIIFNKTIIKNNNIYTLLVFLNKFKLQLNKPQNDLENILKNITQNIYKYVYFLNNKNLISDKESALNFALSIDYVKKDIKSIDNLNLKRGFIQGISHNDSNYLLKYQPNKSILEIVVNCYLKSIDSPYFLTPKMFFINSDNSYFYIIKKYDTDLNKYFGILDKNKKILTIDNILKIVKFIINGVNVLHNNKIIHSDIKLDNIVLNYDENFEITDLKIIDFDVALFNTIPENLKEPCKSFEKIFNNKKARGTRIYMLKKKYMTFKNDVYSIGVLFIILLYKSIKIILNQNKNKDTRDVNNKKSALKYNTLIKKLNILNDGIELNKNKFKMINVMEDFYLEYLQSNEKKNNLEEVNNKDSNNKFMENIPLLENNIIDNNLSKKFKIYKNFIKDCINIKYDVDQLINKYQKDLF